jgi:hypothetical protein
MSEESRPLFSKDLRNRLSIYLKTIRAGERKIDLNSIQAGISLIVDALLEM